MKTLLVILVAFIANLALAENLSQAELQKQSFASIGIEARSAVSRVLRNESVGSADSRAAITFVQNGNFDVLETEDPDLHQVLKAGLNAIVAGTESEPSEIPELIKQLVERLSRDKSSVFRSELKDIYMNAYRARSVTRLNELEKLCELIHPFMVELEFVPDTSFERSNVYKRLRRRRIVLARSH